MVHPSRVFSWSRRRDSNPEPAVYKTAALPIELRRRKAQEHTAVVSEAHRRSYGHGPFPVKRAWAAERAWVVRRAGPASGAGERRADAEPGRPAVFSSDRTQNALA